MESIPNKDDLYIRVCDFHFDRRGNIKNEAFEPRKPHNSGKNDDCGKKSVDWCRYSTPEETIARTDNPKCKRCYSLSVGSVREIGVLVKHQPILNHSSLPDNYAHSIYHSSQMLVVTRIACESDGYEQPSEEQLDKLRQVARPAPQ